MTNSTNPTTAGSAGPLEEVHLGSCPTCKGPAQFIEGGEVRHLETIIAPPVSVIPQITYTSAPALEVRVLGEGEEITQEQALAEIAELNAAASVAEGALPVWRLETPHELFALRSPLTHENQHGAHSYDDSITDDYYWTSEETPWCDGGRIVFGAFNGSVLRSIVRDGCAKARAVRVAGQE